MTSAHKAKVPVTQASAQKVATTAASAQSCRTAAAVGADDSALGQYLPAFKRKRIEKWCLEVAQHLRSGSLCRSVLGHPDQDSKGLEVASPRTPLSAADRQPETLRAGATSTAPDGTSPKAPKAVGGGGSPSEKPTLAATSANIGLDGPLAASVPAKTEPAPRRDPSPSSSPKEAAPAGRAASEFFSSAVSVIKLSGYGEQRRRIERLVLGLPVFPSAASSAGGGGPARADRVTSYTSGSSGVTIYVHGEEPLRGSSARGTSSAACARVVPATRETPVRFGHGSSSRASSAEPRLQYQHGGTTSAGQPSVAARSRHTASPGHDGSRRSVLLQNSRSDVTSPSRQHYSKLLTSAEVVVIEDSEDLFRFGKPGNSESRRTGFPPLNFDLTSVMVKKSPPQKLNKER